MKPWRTVASSEGRPAFVLKERDGEYLVQVDGKVLMGSRRHGSEEALAEAGCARLRVGRPRVLIGGLGFGYTLRAALDRLPEGAEVVVAELSPEIVAWNHAELAPLANRPLDDPRARVIVGDLRRVLRDAESFDAILLDVDNGPEAVTRDANASLYDASGLHRLAGALKPGGTLVVWSAGPDARFERRMQEAGLRTEVRWVKAGPSGRARHVLFLGTRAMRRRPTAASGR